MIVTSEEFSLLCYFVKSVLTVSLELGVRSGATAPRVDAGSTPGSALESPLVAPKAGLERTVKVGPGTKARWESHHNFFQILYFRTNKYCAISSML